MSKGVSLTNLIFALLCTTQAQCNMNYLGTATGLNLPSWMLEGDEEMEVKKVDWSKVPDIVLTGFLESQKSD